MRAEDLYRLMEEPSELTEGTLLELRRIVEDYPYFQVARMLYLKNLAVLNDMSFTSELEKMAIFLPDRKKLFQLIEGDKYGLNSRVEHEPDMRKEDTFSLIDAFLSNRNEEPEPKKEAPFLFQPSVSSDYMFWSLSKEEEEKPEPGDTEPEPEPVDPGKQPNTGELGYAILLAFSAVSAFAVLKKKSLTH